VVGTGNRRTVVTYLAQNHQVSITRACKTTGFSKSQYYYQSKKDDSEVVDKLNELVENKPNRGFPYFFHRIRNEGYVWNHKKVKRVYKLMNLNKRRKHKRRLPVFLRLVQMIIAPLVITTLIVGIAKMGNLKAVGRVGGR